MIRYICIITLCAITLFGQTTYDAALLANRGYFANARALGMGNAFTGVSDDASAMFFNPAGLGLVKRFEVTGGFDYFRYTNQSEFYGTSTTDKSNKLSLNQAAFVIPIPTLRGSLVFGLAYDCTPQFTAVQHVKGQNSSTTSYTQALLAFGNQYDQLMVRDIGLADNKNVTGLKGNLLQEATYLNSGALHNWTFSGAMEVAPNLFVGGNLVLQSGSFKRTSNISENDALGIYTNTLLASNDPGSDGFIQATYTPYYEWDITGIYGKFGLLYQVPKTARFGFTVETPKYFSIEESDYFDAVTYWKYNNPLYLQSPSDYTYKYKFDVTIPVRATIAASGTFAGLTASGEITWMDYSGIEFSSPDGDYNYTSRNQQIKNELQEVFDYNLGFEYTVPNSNMRVRAGYFTQNTPYKNMPSGYDKQYLTFGVGFLFERSITLDIAYLHGWWKEHGDMYTYNYQPVARFTSDITVTNVAFSMHYRF
ncbi:MAG: outer membrane protein transport protein [Ignavibacteria bacterium]|nr:outer membrane protein transport protein [Ignavibacteria bacterium]